MNNANLSRELVAKLKTKYSGLETFDVNMKASTSDDTVRHAKFMFTTAGGEELGHVTINLVKLAVGKEQSAKTRLIDTIEVLFDKAITDNLTDETAKEWYAFLVDIRLFAKHKLLRFDARDITRNNAEEVVEESATTIIRRLLGRY